MLLRMPKPLLGDAAGMCLTAVDVQQTHHSSLSSDVSGSRSRPCGRETEETAVIDDEVPCG